MAADNEFIDALHRRIQERQAATYIPTLEVITGSGFSVSDIQMFGQPRTGTNLQAVDQAPETLPAAPDGRLVRFPLERRLAAIQAERDAQNASESLEAEYVRKPGWFGIRLRPLIR